MKSEEFATALVFLTIEIMFTIEFAVVGTGDGVNLFIEHGDLIGFQTIGQVSGKRAFIERLARRGDNKEFEGTACDRMVSRNTDAVTDQRI